MELIHPSFKIINQDSGLLGLYKIIEQAARVSYKSENRITENSYKDLIDKLLNNKHYSPFEFGTLYFTIEVDSPMYDSGYIHKIDIVRFYKNNKYSHVNETRIGTKCFYHITTNARVLIENERIVDINYMVEPTKHHEKRICVKFILSRGTSHEFVRHRVMSFIQESTRYCNYSTEKFGKQVVFIIPSWSNIQPAIYPNFCYLDADLDNKFLYNLHNCQEFYFDLLKNGWKPEQAREVLPNALKTELWMCGFKKDWEHFFELRCSPSAHPSARQLAIPLKEEFSKLEIDETI